MTKMIDIRQQRFGRLVALQPVGTAQDGSAIWQCKCDCGNYALVRSVSLRKGITRSCGCLKREIAREQILKNPKTSKNIGNFANFGNVHPKNLNENDLPRATNHSGFTGVSFDKTQGNWTARLYLNGRYVLNRSFRDKMDAVDARLDAERKYL